MEDNKVADATLITVLCLLFLLYFIYKIWPRRTHQKERSHILPRTNIASIMIITGSGGHTREILCLVGKIGSKYSPRYYIIADTDQISEQKVHTLEEEIKCNSDTEVKYSIHKVPRSREVSQSWATTVVSTIYAILCSFPIVFKLKPDVILCNGPGTCIPVCFAGLLLKWLHIKNTVVIYVESICRVESLSMSAKILYHFADHMLVQWPQLLDKHPKCQHIGRIV